MIKQIVTSGLTFLECILTLLIVSILASYLVINYARYTQRVKITLAANQLQNAIALARNMALTTHTTIILCASEDQKSCNATWQNNYIIKSPYSVLYHFDLHFLPGKLYVRLFKANNQYLVFSPDGLANFSNGTIWFCLAKAKTPAFAIIINKALRSRIILANNVAKPLAYTCR